MKYFIASLIVVIFSGCLSTTIPPRSEYRINPDIKAKVVDVGGCKDKSLKVAQAFSSSSLLSQNMNYALGDSAQYIYSASLWSTAPSRAVTSEFLTLIRDSKLFKSVQISKSRSRNDFILELSIEDFMQYFNEDSSHSYSNVVVSLSLINTRTNTVVASETFMSKVDAPSLDASGGVEGLNKALAEVLGQSNVWLSKVCK